jgi:hypothetical protein
LRVLFLASQEALKEEKEGSHFLGKRNGFSSKNTRKREGVDAWHTTRDNFCLTFNTTMFRNLRFNSQNIKFWNGGAKRGYK